MSPDYSNAGLDVPPVVPMHDTGRVAVFVGVGYRMLTIAQARALAEGEGDTVETMLALSRAELSLQLVTQVRDRALEAYQEIMRLQV